MAVHGGVPGVVGFSIPEKRAGTAAIISPRSGTKKKPALSERADLNNEVQKV